MTKPVLDIQKRHFQVIGILALVTILSLPPLVNLFIVPADAAGLASYKVNIGNSQAGATTSHNFQFNTPSTTAISTIQMQYCTTASGSCTAPSGMVLASSPTLGTVTGIAGTGYSISGSNATCNGTGNSNCTLTLTVSSPSSQTASATVVVPVISGITNPTTTNTTYFARITTNSSVPAVIDGPDAAAFAILTSSSIAVSASVDPNFTFTVAGVSSGGNFNGGSGNIAVTSTANTIPFGTLTAGTAKIAAQDVTVTTNAGGGYTIIASHSGVLNSAPLNTGSNNIDSFSGTNASPATWSAPAGTSANTNTGYFGYSSEDATLCTGTANRFTSGGAKWAGSSITGGEVACNTTGVSSETTRLGWQVEVNNIQPAGSYTGTVILVATPTY